MSAIHSIDHLRRLIDRCQEQRSIRARELDLEPLGKMLLISTKQASLELAGAAMSPENLIGETDSPGSITTPDGNGSTESRLKQVWEELEVQAEKKRHRLIANAARGEADASVTIGKLDTLRWIRRVSYHLWRIMHYLSGDAQEDEITSAEMPAPEPGE